MTGLATASGGPNNNSTMLSHVQVSMTTRSHLRTRDTQKRLTKNMVLKQDQAISPSSPQGGDSRYVSALGDEMMIKPKGMRTTKHSLVP